MNDEQRERLKGRPLMRMAAAIVFPLARFAGFVDGLFEALLGRRR